LSVIFNGSKFNYLENRQILLFDGFCNLCNGVVQFVIKKDKKNKIKLAPLQSTSGQSLLKQFNLPMGYFTTFVYIKDNKVYLKSSAGLQVLKDLGGFWQLFYFLIVVPKPLRDFIYSIFAKTRYKIFGKRDTCMVPEPGIKNKFLE
jgi:predicted DCC family thiol-disulfide oxidoreductase YuxK